jgi:hypothetical protein
MGSRADLGRASVQLVDGLKRVHYGAPWDGGVRLVTGMVLVVVTVLAIALVVGLGRGLSAQYDHPVVALLPMVFLVVPLLLLWAARAEAPLGYSIDGASVVIERRAGPLAIPIPSIREVRELDPWVFLRRAGGSGGYFGYYGECKHPDLGQVKLYATRSDGRVLLSTDGGIYVLTPATPSRFVDDLRSRVAGGQLDRA